jgi:hypothetical protein
MKNSTTPKKRKLPFPIEEEKNVTTTKNDLSKPETEEDMKYRIMNLFLRPARPLLLELGYSLGDKAFLSRLINENTQHGFNGRCPALRIDYPKIILSKGKLPNPAALSVCSREPGKLALRWKDNSGEAGSLPSDLLFIAVFSQWRYCWMFENYGAYRSDRRYSMDVHILQGKPIQVYAGFISEDGLRVSTSIYLGIVRVL